MEIMKLFSHPLYFLVWLSLLSCLCSSPELTGGGRRQMLCKLPTAWAVCPREEQRHLVLCSPLV